MANADDLIAKRDVLEAIPIEKVIFPNLPVDVFLQETENMIKWADDDKALLATVGFSEQDLADLSVRTGACREAQSLWIKDYRGRKEAQINWNEQSPAAYELRDELIHTFRFAYRSDSHLVERVAAIAEGDGHADMIQDLNDLSVLGKANLELLNAIGFDSSKLDIAAEKAASMAELLALANGSRESGNEMKDLRDRAYTHLKEQADNLRESGRFLFWKNPNRAKGYSSIYRKRKKRKSVQSVDESE